MLVATPQPQPTESLMGYVLRLTQANGYHTMSYILAAMNGHWYRGAIGRLDGAPLREIAGLSSDQVARLTLKPERRPRAYIRIRGEDLPSYEVSLQRCKICPLCLAAGSGCEAFWDLAQAVACPTHHVMLEATCPGCASELTWRRPKVTQCRCGFDLTKLPTRPAAPALCDLMAALRSALYKDSALAPPPDTLSHLRHLELRKLCKLLWVMSGTLYQRQGGVSLPKARTRCLPQLERVATILSNWPRSFQSFLSETYEEVATSADVPKFKTLFSWLMIRLINNDEDGGTCYQFMEEQLYVFGARFWTRGAMSRDDGDVSLVPETVRWGTLSEGAEVLGLHMLTMRKLIASGELKTRSISTTSKRNVIVDLEWARSQKQSRYPAEPIRNAAKRIGVSIETLKAMRANGAYQATYRPTFPGSLAKEDVDLLHTRLRALGRSTRCNVKHGAITVERAFVKYKASPATKAALFAHLLSNPELVKSPGKVRITQMQIDAKTAEQLLYQNVPAAQGYVTAQEVATRLRCLLDTVSKLKRDGHLATRDARGRQMVCEHSLEKFESRYESLTAIATRVGISRKRISMYVDFSAVQHVKVENAVSVDLFIDRQDIARAEILLEASRRPPDPRPSWRLRDRSRTGEGRTQGVESRDIGESCRDVLGA